MRFCEGRVEVEYGPGKGDQGMVTNCLSLLRVYAFDPIKNPSVANVKVPPLFVALVNFHPQFCGELSNKETVPLLLNVQLPTGVKF